MAASNNYTTIPPATSITDANNNVWTLNNGVVYENAKTAGYTAGVAQLAYVNNVIYQENTANLWWKWVVNTWVSTAAPVIPAPPPPGPNTTPMNTSVQFSYYVATANANQNTFIITTNNAQITSNSFFNVYRNGLVEIPTLHYTVRGNVLTFVSHSRANDEVYVVWNH